MSPYGFNELSAYNRAHEFLGQCYQEAQADPGGAAYLEVWVGGYGSNHPHGEIWKIVFDAGGCRHPTS